MASLRLAKVVWPNSALGNDKLTSCLDGFFETCESSLTPNSALGNDKLTPCLDGFVETCERSLTPNSALGNHWLTPCLEVYHVVKKVDTQRCWHVTKYTLD